MSINLSDHITQEAGVFTFNAVNGTEVMQLRPTEAGRCAKGLRLALEGKVDMGNLRVVSEGDPSLAYRYDRKRQLMVEETLTPVLSGKMEWRATGAVDPGYLDERGNARHQVTSHMMAILFLRGVKAMVEITDWNQNAVAIQVALAATPEGERQGAYARLANEAAFAGAW